MYFIVANKKFKLKHSHLQISTHQSSESTEHHIKDLPDMVLHKSIQKCLLMKKLWLHELTGFVFFPRAPGGGPRFKFEEDGCMDGCRAGEGAPTDNADTDCPVFCFLRDAETVGLGTDSWTGCPFAFLQSLPKLFNMVLVKRQNHHSLSIPLYLIHTFCKYK